MFFGVVRELYSSFDLKMTLNYSRRTCYPVNIPEENLVSSSKDWCVFDGPQCFDLKWGNNSFRYDQSGKDASFEPVARDVIDLLPADPFGMEISATITAIAGWVGDYESERVNISWNTTSFRKEPVKKEVYERYSLPDEFDGKTGECSTGVQYDVCGLNWKREKCLSFDSMHPATVKYTESGKGTGFCDNVAAGAPHDALLFALGHLGLKELLSMEMVCSSLRSSIKLDTLLWRNISIHKSSCSKITDEHLLTLTDRAKGNLLCLNLDGCWRISDGFLKLVVDSNKRLRKLNVRGCRGITVDGILKNLRVLKSSDTSGINHLRMGNRALTMEQFVEIKCLIGADKCMQLKSGTPHYFRSDHSSPSCDDDCVIDIEECPRCENPRLVYDCPVESCKEKQFGIEMCRACTICIPRCGECGRCVGDTEYDETFCLEAVCSECRKRPLDYIIFHGEARETSTSGLV